VLKNKFHLTEIIRKAGKFYDTIQENENEEG
jgi:hypothetical protein